jgi:hypothetical protein
MGFISPPPQFIPPQPPIQLGSVNTSLQVTSTNVLGFAAGGGGSGGQFGAITYGRNISSSGNLAAGDVGLLITFTASAAPTITIPTGTFTTGQVIGIQSSGSGSATLHAATGNTLYWAHGAATPGDRTLTAFCLVNLLCLGGGGFLVSGGGIS